MNEIVMYVALLVALSTSSLTTARSLSHQRRIGRSVLPIERVNLGNINGEPTIQRQGQSGLVRGSARVVPDNLRSEKMVNMETPLSQSSPKLVMAETVRLDSLPEVDRVGDNARNTEDDLESLSSQIHMKDRLVDSESEVPRIISPRYHGNRNQNGRQMPYGFSEASFALMHDLVKRIEAEVQQAVIGNDNDYERQADKRDVADDMADMKADKKSFEGMDEKEKAQKLFQDTPIPVADGPKTVKIEQDVNGRVSAGRVETITPSPAKQMMKQVGQLPYPITKKLALAPLGGRIRNKRVRSLYQQNME